ncbi:MAG: arginine repressor [Clostridium sp.]|nr:arginine repressor [Clostridium sp.]
MNKRNSRLETITELLMKNVVCRQEQLMEMLKNQGIDVTQATLSRDLRTLNTSKIPTDDGRSRYVVPQQTSPRQDADNSGSSAIETVRRSSITSIARSDNLLVIKTRYGYAHGLAYDIDTLDNPAFLGTIAGTDTIFVAIEGHVGKIGLRRALAEFVPAEILEKFRDKI